MSKEEREFLEELRTKSVEAAAEIMEGLQRLKLFYDELTDDGSGNPLPRPRTADFFYRLARFELEHASNILRLGNSQAQMLFDHVRQLAHRTKPNATQTSVVLLSLDDAGDTYVGAFEIKNPFEVEADVRFELSELRDASGVATELKPQARCGQGSVGGYRTALVELRIAASDVTTTLFGDVTVFLSASVERQVSKRAVKVRPSDKARSR